MPSSRVICGWRIRCDTKQRTIALLDSPRQLSRSSRSEECRLPLRCDLPRGPSPLPRRQVLRGAPCVPTQPQGFQLRMHATYARAGRGHPAGAEHDQRSANADSTDQAAGGQAPHRACSVFDLQNDGGWLLPSPSQAGATRRRVDGKRYRPLDRQSPFEAGPIELEGRGKRA